MLYIYWPTLILVFCMTLIFPLIGVNLIARDRVLESYALAQGAVVFALGGALIAQVFHLNEDLLSLSLSILGLTALFIFFKKLQVNSQRLKNPLFFIAGTLLFAFSLLFVSLFPSLERYIWRGGGSDLVTMSHTHTVFGIILMLVLIVIMLFFMKRWIAQGINISLFADQYPKKIFDEFSFDTVALLLIAFGIFGLGQLLTLGLMFTAPILLYFCSVRHSSYLIICVLTTTLGSVGGFVMSLYWYEFSTIPLMLVFIAFLSLFFVSLNAVRHRLKS